MKTRRRFLRDLGVSEMKRRRVMCGPSIHLCITRCAFDTDALYKQDLDVIKAKFTHYLMGCGEARKLADDAAWPGGGYNSYNRLMHDLTDWLMENKTYSVTAKI